MGCSTDVEPILKASQEACCREINETRGTGNGRTSPGMDFRSRTSMLKYHLVSLMHPLPIFNRPKVTIRRTIRRNSR